MAKKSVFKNIGKNYVLTRSGKVQVSTAKKSSLRATTSTSTFKPVNTATHTNRVNVSKLRTNAFHKSHSPIRRYFHKPTAPNTRISNEKVNTVRVNGVNTARQTVVSDVKGNGVTTVKASAGCVWRPKMTHLNNVSKDNSGSWVSKRGNPQQALKSKGMFDSGCSRHMTGIKDFLIDYEDIDGGFVAFGGSARGELKFNLFSVSQMCDKKNSVLFTETECLVLSPNFKLLDASQVMLRVPRQSNMYTFDLKNDVSSGNLTCLFAKATIDESKLWHRRLGHTNFKTMNKLLKGNLVRVAERKNRTVIEAARTMLADSLLPTIFWAVAVNTACYVLNRVLVTKPHNKTPYELIIGKPPSISFMRPFGFPITILNTLDPLGKFNGKAKEGFLVGYSVNSKAFRVFNSQTRKVKENLHVNFLENKPNVAGQGPNWHFDIDSLRNSMNYQPVTTGNQTNKNAGPQEANGNTSLKQSVNAGQSEEKNSSDENDTVDDSASESPVQKPTSENEHALKNVLDKMLDQEKEATKQSDAVRKEFEAQFNAASASRTYNDVGPSFVPLGGSFPNAPLMPDLEDTAEVQNGIFGSAYNDEDLDTYNSPYADQVMGTEADFKKIGSSTVQEPTKIAQGLDDESWVEAMQEELLQLKIQKVWTLVDLPYGKKAIGTKWVYRNKKDERDFEQIMHKRFQMSSMGELTFFLGLQVKQKEDGIFISQANRAVTGSEVSELLEPLYQPLLSSTKAREGSSVDENVQKNDTSLEELHNLAGGTDIKVIHLELMLSK
ncbi:ribonuclease H-like domain-containing protein [Tanacetum coccineum]